jgi:hypothetical protein
MQGYRTSIIQNDKTCLDFQEAYAFVETALMRSYWPKVMVLIEM